LKGWKHEESGAKEIYVPKEKKVVEGEEGGIDEKTVSRKVQVGGAENGEIQGEDKALGVANGQAYGTDGADEEVWVVVERDTPAK